MYLSRSCSGRIVNKYFERHMPQLITSLRAIFTSHRILFFFFCSGTKRRDEQQFIISIAYILKSPELQRYRRQQLNKIESISMYKCYYRQQRRSFHISNSFNCRICDNVQNQMNSTNTTGSTDYRS